MMPAGKYWIGDLCYVMHPQWDEVCSITITKDRDCLEGQFCLKNGVRFAVYGTAYGDGSYRDQDGTEYGVDSGTLGCIRVEDIDDPEADPEAGRVVEFVHPFHTGSDGKVISFGNIRIDTDMEEYEDFEYEEEED